MGRSSAKLCVEIGRGVSFFSFFSFGKVGILGLEGEA